MSYLKIFAINKEREVNKLTLTYFILNEHTKRFTSHSKLFKVIFPITVYTD